MRYTIRVDADGNVEGIGVDIGGREELAGVRDEHTQPAFIALRAPGQTYWTGLGMPWSYAAAESRFFRVVGVEGWDGQRKTGRLDVVRLLDVPLPEART